MKQRTLSKTKLSFAAVLFLVSNSIAQDINQKLNDVYIIAQDANTSYTTYKNPSLSRSNVELGDMSRSIQVFNEKVISDLQPQSIEEIVTLSSNTSYNGDSSGRGETYNVRGFDAPIFKDGIRFDGIPAPEMYDLQSVEILKGPDSIQFGQGNPGGLINYVKKKPKMENHREIEIEANTNPGYQLKTDIGGLINENGSLRYRLIGVYKDDSTIKDFNTDYERIYLAPSFVYDFNDNHSIKIWGEYLDEEEPREWGSLIDNNGKVLIDPKTVIGHPDNFTKKDQKNFSLELDSNFKNWKTNFTYTRLDYSYDNGNDAIPISADPVAGTVTRAFATQISKNKVDNFKFTANNEFYLADIKNRITLGYDYRRIKTDFEGVFFPRANLVLDAHNPVYEASLPTIADYPGAFSYGGPTASKQSGVFIQNYMNLTDSLILSYALRYSKFKPDDGQKSTATTPQLGLVYKIDDSLSIYANYSQSFLPTTSQDSNGNILDPEEGKGFEIGTKYNINDSLSINAAIFKIEKDNVPTTDPNNPLASISDGLQESKGIEFDLIGEIKPGWSILASYGYVETEDKGNNPGKDLPGVPTHSANLITTYNLSSLGLPEITIGGGAKFLGKRFGASDGSNTLELPTVVTFNTSVAYESGPWSANFSVKNISDEVYAKTAWAGNGRGAEIADPRQAVLTITYKF